MLTEHIMSNRTSVDIARKFEAQAILWDMRVKFPTILLVLGTVLLLLTMFVRSHTDSRFYVVSYPPIGSRPLLWILTLPITLSFHFLLVLTCCRTC